MISGAHSIIYSTNPDADRAFFRDVLNLPHVDVGGGWLIFGLPPAEVALHRSDRNDVHEFYLMCDDIEALVLEMRRRNLNLRARSRPRLGVAHAINASGRRKAWHLPAAARPAEGDGRREVSAEARQSESKEVRQPD